MGKTTYKTLELPIELIQETKKIIQSGKANSFDEFVALVLKHELLNLEQAENQIDLKVRSIFRSSHLGTRRESSYRWCD